MKQNVTRALHSERGDNDLLGIDYNRQLFYDCYTFNDIFYSCLKAKVKANCFYEYEDDDILFGIHLRNFYENFPKHFCFGK